MQPPLSPPAAASATAAPVGAASITADAAQPRRSGDPVAADAAPTADASAGFLDRVIDWSARNVFLVLLATLFLIGGGLYAVKNTPLDALPDLSDVQVIVYTDYPGQAPQVVEDQVTYPLTTSMLAVPRAKVVRGFSMFGASYVYVIFEDGTDIYWARSRVLEYLNQVQGRLPPGARLAVSWWLTMTRTHSRSSWTSCAESGSAAPACAAAIRRWSFSAPSRTSTCSSMGR